MLKKVLCILIIISFILFLFGINIKIRRNKNVINEKVIIVSSCKELLTSIDTWIHENNKDVIYYFLKENKGKYFVNGIVNNFTYDIIDTNLIIDNNIYSLSCDLKKNTITLSDKEENNTYIVKKH